MYFYYGYSVFLMEIIIFSKFKIKLVVKIEEEEEDDEEEEEEDEEEEDDDEEEEDEDDEEGEIIKKEEGDIDMDLIIIEVSS